RCLPDSTYLPYTSLFRSISALENATDIGVTLLVYHTGMHYTHLVSSRAVTVSYLINITIVITTILESNSVVAITSLVNITKVVRSGEHTSELQSRENLVW